MSLRRSYILVIIVFSQFACVSLWFAGNGVMSDLITSFHLPENILGHLTSAVQLGFIAGTLLFAIFSIADRISPSRVFFFSAMLAAIVNLGLMIAEGQIWFLYGSRFLTGFFLAGIYPVGMKIAADYYDKDLGKALGYLLGALVLGTAFPHFLRSQLDDFPWQHVIKATSLFAFIGGALVFFLIPDGPFRKKGSGFEGGFIFHLFDQKNFKAAAFGYFGHMWELYAFWAFIPVILPLFTLQLTNVSLTSFSIMGIGAIGCVFGGYAAQRIGSYRVAFIALTSSGLCCLVSPLVFKMHPSVIMIFLLFWGMMVIMDSPQFSTLIAQAAPAENKASALTIVNCIGFSITIVSIQLLNSLLQHISMEWLFIFLLPGPLLGLLAMKRWSKPST